MKQSNPNEERAVRRIILSVASALAISAIAAGIWIFSRDVPSAHAGEAGRASIVEAFRHELPNVPGKSLVGLAVTYPPGSKTPSHHHAPSAFITGFVLPGADPKSG